MKVMCFCVWSQDGGTSTMTAGSSWHDVANMWVNEVIASGDFATKNGGAPFGARTAALVAFLQRATSVKIKEVMHAEGITIGMPVGQTLEMFPTEKHGVGFMIDD